MKKLFVVFTLLLFAIPSFGMKKLPYKNMFGLTGDETKEERRKILNFHGLSDHDPDVKSVIRWDKFFRNAKKKAKKKQPTLEEIGILSFGDVAQVADFRKKKEKLTRRGKYNPSNYYHCEENQLYTINQIMKKEPGLRTVRDEYLLKRFQDDYSCLEMEIRWMEKERKNLWLRYRFPPQIKMKQKENEKRIIDFYLNIKSISDEEKRKRYLLFLDKRGQYWKLITPRNTDPLEYIQEISKNHKENRDFREKMLQKYFLEMVEEESRSNEELSEGIKKFRKESSDLKQIKVI